MNSNGNFSQQFINNVHHRICLWVRIRATRKKKTARLQWNQKLCNLLQGKGLGWLGHQFCWIMRNSINWLSHNVCWMCCCPLKGLCFLQFGEVYSYGGGFILTWKVISILLEIALSVCLCVFIWLFVFLPKTKLSVLFCEWSCLLETFN